MSFLKPSKIKIARLEGCIYVRIDGGYITVGQRSSVYLLVPDEIRSLLLREFGIDLKHKPKKFNVHCQLMNDNGDPKLIFSFSPKGDVIAEKIREEVKSVD